MSFKSCRYAAKIKLREAAEYMGVSEQAVCAWEAGRSYPAGDKLLRLATLYGCTVDALLREDPAEPAEEVTEP